MSRVSKGKLKHLWDLYGVWDIISYRSSTVWYFEPDPEFKATVDKWLIRMEDPKVIDRIARFRKTMDDHLAQPMVRQVATKGYYDGCRKLDTEFDVETVISLDTMDNPTHLTLVRGKPKPDGSPGKLIAYDIEANLLWGATHQTEHTDKVWAEGSFDKIADLDIAETYPKTLEVFDEEKFDRLVSGMLAIPPTA